MVVAERALMRDWKKCASSKQNWILKYLIDNDRWIRCNAPHSWSACGKQASFTASICVGSPQQLNFGMYLQKKSTVEKRNHFTQSLKKNQPSLGEFVTEASTWPPQKRNLEKIQKDFKKSCVQPLKNVDNAEIFRCENHFSGLDFYRDGNASCPCCNARLLEWKSNLCDDTSCKSNWPGGPECKIYEKYVGYCPETSTWPLMKPKKVFESWLWTRWHRRKYRRS